MDIDDVLGTGESLPSITTLLINLGDKVVGQIISDPKVLQCKEFIRGKPGEFIFFQGKKIVPQRDLNLQLPYEPVPQVVFDIQTKDGKRYTAWMDKEKLKALRAARKRGEVLAKGGMIAIEITELVENNTANPKKVYTVQLKAPKE
jgi:hypothetical protein